LVTRFGGEEFLIVLPDANLEMAAKVVERIMIAVRNDTEVTISSGLAMFTPDISFEQLVKNADDALYLAKKQGRDRFVIADNIYADKACLIN
jgi:diguanylate cyclase (GGDEF)-like protein